MKLVLYHKPGCHLCEGLLEKLQQVQTVPFELELRDIEADRGLFDRYQYEIPVLCVLQGEREIALPRLSPRAPLRKLEELLQNFG